jgi:hypothetical protein
MTNEQDINNQYDTAKNEIGMLLGWIADEVNAHEEFHADELNYGHVGDLTRLRRNLINALSGISGHDAVDIEELMKSN